MLPPARSVLALAAALVPRLLPALALWAGEAPAQSANVCRGGAHTGGGPIVCEEAAGSTNNVLVDPGSVTIDAHGASNPGIGIRHQGTGNIELGVSGGSRITAHGSSSHVLFADHQGTGGMRIVMTGVSLSARGASSDGIRGSHSGTGDLTIDVTGGSLTSEGAGSGGIRGSHSGAGDLTIDMTGGSIAEASTGALIANHSGRTGDITVNVRGGSLSSRGQPGISASRTIGTGSVNVALSGRGGAVETAGTGAAGLYVYTNAASGEGSIEMTGGSIETMGDEAHGAHVRMDNAASTAALTIDATGGAITVEGWGARGLLGTHDGLGSVEVTTGAGMAIQAPFAVGMEARVTNDANAAGRLVVTHAGAVEARDVGVLAWAARSSGHTMGAGAQTADDAARTAPMIHVTSSGRVTVGASVTDAFRRSRVVDAGETLGRAIGPSADAPGLPAEQILGLSRAGIRASALSHTAIADYVGGGDALSTAERTVLEAVLTGRGLETALSAISGAAYTTAWKNGVRQHAATYNAGDIRVDVTGGSISAEGNGVEALYAVPHDDNGAIAVSVAEGARVAGGGNGVYVRNAGAGAGSLRAQSVTVNGEVTGGTGAGVHMVGGGRLTVGAAGRVGATSGVGVLADGDLTVVIEQRDGDVGRVTGRIEETGGDGDPEVWIQAADAATAVRVTGAFGTKGATLAGAFDVGIVADGGGVRVESGYAPRARVYEALPSVLLGLNRLPEFRDRMSAPRSAKGGWARVEGFRDKWKADRSTSTSGLEYAHRRYGLNAGMDVAADEYTLLGASFHHRRGKAKVTGGGEIDVSGRGVGASGAWGLAGADDAMTYVGVQAEVTQYEADFRSSLRGALKTDASGRGNALGVEAGRRFERGGMVLTPRVGLTHSKVSMDDFTDAVGVRVSVEDGRSLRGRAGMAVEMTPGGASGSRVFGSLDVEHEFSPKTKAVVSGADLKAAAKATWLRLGVNGAHAWGEDGRYAVEGGVSYATNGGGNELGGGVSVKVWF